MAGYPGARTQIFCELQKWVRWSETTRRSLLRAWPRARAKRPQLALQTKKLLEGFFVWLNAIDIYLYASICKMNAKSDTLNSHQLLFQEIFIGTLIYAVVLGFFNDYTNIVSAKSFSTIFLLA